MAPKPAAHSRSHPALARRREIFGPVQAILKYHTTEEVGPRFSFECVCVFWFQFQPVLMTPAEGEGRRAGTGFG